MEQKFNEQRNAYTLYMQTELTQEQIADLLNVNRKTLYLWIKEGKWLRMKRAAMYTPSMLTDQYYRQLLALNTQIEARAEAPYPTKAEAEVIRKLAITIKQIKTRPVLSESMETMTLFMEHLQNRNTELAQDVSRHTLSFFENLMEKTPVNKVTDEITAEVLLEEKIKQCTLDENNNNDLQQEPNIIPVSGKKQTSQNNNAASARTQVIDFQHQDTPSNKISTKQKQYHQFNKNHNKKYHKHPAHKRKAA